MIQRVLLPLCGKSVDLAYLSKKHDVVGVESIEQPIVEFGREHPEL